MNSPCQDKDVKMSKALDAWVAAENLQRNWGGEISWITRTEEEQSELEMAAAGAQTTFEAAREDWVECKARSPSFASIIKDK